MKNSWPEKTPNGNGNGKHTTKKLFDETLKKKLSDVDRQKKSCFLSEVKKKVCKQQQL